MLTEMMWVELHVTLFSAIHRSENRLLSCPFNTNDWVEADENADSRQISCVVHDGLNLCRFWVTIMESLCSLDKEFVLDFTTAMVSNEQK